MDLLASGCPIRGASIGRYPLSERASTLVRQACNQVPQQQAYAAPDAITRVASYVALAVDHFARASHVQPVI
jgi:hypothetical protein